MLSDSYVRPNVSYGYVWTGGDMFGLLQVNSHHTAIHAGPRHEQLRCDMTVDNFMVTLRGLTLFVDAVVKRFHTELFCWCGIGLLILSVN